MMVANSFDLWTKDCFFSAAEEVQESADIMESAFRLWVRERREGLKAEDLDELCRELQTALGTAKWQLEEFERAVGLSQRHRCNDSATVRHRQFIAAIEDQISRVETALREAFSEEGKQPLRWINLDEEERDDLATFLSGNSPTSSTVKDECIKFRPSVKNSHLESSHKGSNCSGSINKNSECVIDVEEESPETRDDTICTADRTIGARRTWSSPNLGSLKIVIADESGDGDKSMADIESTPKEKGFKPVFWKQRCPEHPQTKGVVNVFNQLLGGFQRQRQSSMHSHFNRSVQLMLVLMLTVFLIVPFVLYST